MAYRNRTCYLDGRNYKYCPDCREDAGKPYFLSTFCSENCKVIFQTCVDYNMKLISKEKAQEILRKCDLSGQASFRNDVQETIKVIMTEPKQEETVKQSEPEKKFARIEYPKKAKQEVEPEHVK